MAALEPTEITRIPFGNRWLIFGSVTPTGAGDNTDHILPVFTKLADVEFGIVISTGATGRAVNVMRNSVGSGTAEDTTMGAFAFETAGTELLLFFAIGR